MIYQEKAEYEAKFTKWLEENYPEVLEETKEFLTTRASTWDLSDGVDFINSRVYGEWCEIET